MRIAVAGATGCWMSTTIRRFTKGTGRGFVVLNVSDFRSMYHDMTVAFVLGGR